MRRHPNQRGFSLAEAVTALAILAVLGAGLANHGRQHTDAVAHGFAETYALRAAQSELERARTIPAAELVPGTSVRLTMPGHEGSSLTLPPTLRALEGWRRVAAHPDSTRLRLVEVVVRWSSTAVTAQREICLSTLRCTEATR